MRIVEWDDKIMVSIFGANPSMFWVSFYTKGIRDLHHHGGLNVCRKSAVGIMVEAHSLGRLNAFSVKFKVIFFERPIDALAIIGEQLPRIRPGLAVSSRSFGKLIVAGMSPSELILQTVACHLLKHTCGI